MNVFFSDFFEPSADFYKFDPGKHQLIFGFSISIPATDLGQSASLAVNKDGSCKLTD